MSDIGNKEIFSGNLKFYMQKFDKTRNDVCDDLGFKYTTFSDWVNGKKYPRIDKIEMLANYFGVEKSDLIEDKPKTPTKTSD
ncbi:helix-turn-helix transcriptional regulator [Eubacterium callanderi]|uniref:helix-turn-helix domain-containing protein n=3 Tax=Eubacteriaceae TaxID=186806 RepID=UPI0026740E2C|nr:helix-turn-helix transcriptional regulator [Eubacterium callanderi]